MNKSFKQFCKNFKGFRKKDILKVFYEYIRKEKENEKKRN